MQYIKVTVLDVATKETFECFQEVDQGNLVRYRDGNGDEILLPEVCESAVVDDKPPIPKWADQTALAAVCTCKGQLTVDAVVAASVALDKADGVVAVKAVK